MNYTFFFLNLEINFWSKVSSPEKIVFMLFAQMETTGESVKIVHEQPKIEIKFKSITNSMWYAKWNVL